MSEIISLPEPRLEFALGEQLEHPRDGLTLFGPIDSKGIEKPVHVCYAAFGTSTGLAALGRFVRAMNGPIRTDNDLDEVLWPHFPGFEEAFHAVLPREPAWKDEIPEEAITSAAMNQDVHQRVYGVVSLFLDKLRIAKKRDDPFRVFVVVVPDLVYANCPAIAILWRPWAPDQSA